MAPANYVPCPFGSKEILIKAHVRIRIRSGVWQRMSAVSQFGLLHLTWDLGQNLFVVMIRSRKTISGQLQETRSMDNSEHEIEFCDR